MSDDLFKDLDSLFNKRRPDSLPYSQVINRFLASDSSFAPAAHLISQATWDDAMTWQIWAAALPRAAKAPTLRYPAPKRESAAEALVSRVMEVHHVRRSAAEDMVDLLWGTIKKDNRRRMEVLRYYGINNSKAGDS